jgi:5-methylcytosine-specific restriction endonuclease McrA
MTQVLVLNQDYQALHVCDYRQAVNLVWLQKAELIADHPQRKLRTVRADYPLPVVIRLHAFVRRPFQAVALTRNHVFRRDGHRCVYCGHSQDLTLDHVQPRAKGGRTQWTNLVTACRRCNSQKGDLSLEEAGLTLPQRPYRPGFIMFHSRLNGSMAEAWKPFLYH